MMKKTMFGKMIAAALIAATVAGVSAPGAGKSAMAAAKTVKTPSIEDLYRDMDAEIEKDDDSYRISGGGLTGFVEYDITDTGMGKRRKASKARTETDEYNDRVADYVGCTMNQQMKSYLYGTSGKKAECVNVFKDTTSVDRNGARSYFKFTLSIDKIGRIPDSDTMLGYLADAIAEYPNLCTLFTGMGLKNDDKNIYLTVVSTHRAEAQKEAVETYKSFLADIEKTPKKSNSMTDEDILLYLYDRVALSAEYATKEVRYESYDSEYFKIHTPVEIAESGKIVCQSYAAVLNHLMKDLGFTSYNVWSKTHAWNAVKMKGNWYYFDVTWDDGLKDSVGHEYMYARTSSFSGSHDLNNYYSQKLSGITNKFGSDYEGYYPKSSGKKNAFYYVADRWVFMDNGIPCESVGNDFSNVQALDIPVDSSRCIAVLDGKLYYGGADGIFRFDVDSRESEKKYKSSVYAMFLRRDRVIVKTADKWKYFADENYVIPAYDESRCDGNGSSDASSNVTPTPSPAPKPTPSDEDEDEDSGREPTSYEENRTPHFLVNAVGKKSIKVRLYDMNPDGSDLFEVQCSTKKDFSSNVKTVTSVSESAQFKGLKSGRTYYVRVRALNKKGNYSEWTDARKLKLKK